MKQLSIHVAAIMAATFAAGTLAQDNVGLHGAAALDPMDGPTQPAVPVQQENVPPAIAAERVRTAIEQSEGVQAKDISVTSHAGTIVLTGQVNDPEEGARAAEIAETAADGARVSSNLEVRPLEERPVGDQQAAQLVGDVRSALQADKRTGALGVAVSSEQKGIIVLHGLVPTVEGRKAAQDIASRVPGVVRVESRMIVPQN